MSDAPQELPRSAGNDWWGCSQLLRAFRISIHPTKLVLALCAMFATYLAGRSLDGMWSTQSTPAILAESGATELSVFIGPGGGLVATQKWVEQNVTKKTPRQGVFVMLLGHARMTVNHASNAVTRLSIPELLTAVQFGLLGLLWAFVMHPGYSVFFIFVSMIIWAIFGGALARATALHATRDERLGMRDALAFARQKFISFVGAPLMPLGVILIVGVLLWLGGIIGLIPGLGEVLVGLVFFLPLIAGFILAFAIIGGVAGFPLTYPTIAVEGSDAFDSLSRTFSYVYQRPWRTALYAIISMAYGAVCFLFVKFFARIMLWSMHFFLGLSMNWGTAQSTLDEEKVPIAGKLNAIWQAPPLTGFGPFYGTFDDATKLSGMSWFAQLLLKAWIYGLWVLVASFVISFFFSTSTLIYLLLRRDVDATDFEDVYLEEPAVESTAASPTSAAPPTGGTSLPVIGQG